MYVSDRPIRPRTKFRDFLSSTNADYKEVMKLNLTKVIQAPQLQKWNLKQCIVHLQKTCEQTGYSWRGPRPGCRNNCAEKDKLDKEAQANIVSSCASDMPSSHQSSAPRSSNSVPKKDFLFRPRNPGKSDTEQNSFIGILHSKVKWTTNRKK